MTWYCLLLPEFQFSIHSITEAWLTQFFFYVEFIMAWLYIEPSFHMVPWTGRPALDPVDSDVQ